MNLKKYLKKKNYLLKLLLTIAGFVCIPLIVTQILMLERSASSFTKLSEENIFENLRQSISSFDEKLKEMSNVAFKVGLDNIVRKAAKPGASEYAIYEVAMRIHEFDRDDWTTGVWFCQNQNNFVLFDQVNITPERLFVRVAGEKVQHSEKIKDFFESVDQLSVMSTVEYVENGVIVVARPVSIFFAREEDAIVFFVMDQDVVEEEIMRRFHDCAGVALLDQTGHFLVRSDGFSAQMCETEEFREFLKSNGRTSFISGSEEKKVTIYKYRDVDTGYSCLVSIFEDDMEAQLRQHVSTIRNILIVSIILMLMLLGVTVRINYRPIMGIINKHGDKAASNELSELELLESAFFSADQKIISREKLLKNFVISDLLGGKEVDEKLVEGSFPEGVGYGGTVIALDGPAINSEWSNEVTDKIKLKCGCDSYITGIIYRPQILLVCILHSDRELMFLREYLGDILWEVTGHRYHISYGEVVDKITDIRTSYLQSLTMSNAREAQEVNAEVEEAIQKFAESLYVGEISNMQRLLDVVESHLAALKGIEGLEKYYCYKLLTVYFAGVKDIKELKGERNRLITFNDTKQLFVMLRQSIRRLCVKLGENEQAAANKLSKKLLDYVDENFNNRNLCLTSAADHLETSIYVISRLFKEATGKGFKEYITDKRLEYARELFSTTLYSVSEVSNMSGFENTTYFSQIFKAKYGLPPSQYRKKYQE